MTCHSRFLFLPRSLGLTRGSVHIRDRASLRNVMATIVVAALPCVLVGLYNTGYQANGARMRLSADVPEGWRSGLLTTLGVPLDAGSILACGLHGALYLLPVFVVAWSAGGAVERIFARVRARPRVAGLLPTALLFTLLLPPATPLWQVALGMSFGTVFAKELFGGTGMGFVCAPALGAAFLSLAYPNAMVGDPLWTGLRGYGGTAIFSQIAGSGTTALADAGVSWSGAFLGRVQGLLGTTSALACMLGAVLLVVRGIASWRSMVGVLLGAFAATLILGAGGSATGPMATLGWTWHIVLGAFAFGAVFLVADPTSAATTNLGRWIVGLLVGFLVVLIRVANPLHPDGVVFAVLFGNVFAPLIDNAVVWLHLWWHAWLRRRSHG